MSRLVRIRLSFQRCLPLAEAKNCWFLFDASTCSTIADLEYLIKARFGGLSRSSSTKIMHLYLDDYLLPSQEKIDIIQQNDNIRVVLKQLIITSSSEEDQSCQDVEQKRKRKKKNISPVVRNKSKTKKSKTSANEVGKDFNSVKDVICHESYSSESLKKKKSKTSANEVGKNFHSVQDVVCHESYSSESSKKKKSKTSANEVGKDFHSGKDVILHESYSSESSSSTESSSELDESGPSKLNSKACTNSVNGIKSTDLKATKGRTNHGSKSSLHGKLGKDVKNNASTFTLPKENKGKVANGIASKSSSASQGIKEGAVHIRFDSEDETVKEQEEVCSMNNITDDFESTVPFPNLIASNQNDQTSSIKATEQKEPAKRDYSLCTPLQGPPRSKDKIAYKMLELSASYTPEVSDYKEGTVLSYEANSGAVTIELTKESLKKARGDGNVSRKFELDYDDEQENGENVDNEETDPEVVVLWSSMLDPVLID